MKILIFRPISIRCINYVGHVSLWSHLYSYIPHLDNNIQCTKYYFCYFTGPIMQSKKLLKILTYTQVQRFFILMNSCRLCPGIGTTVIYVSFIDNLNIYTICHISLFTINIHLSDFLDKAFKYNCSFFSYLTIHNMCSIICVHICISFYIMFEVGL